ncbi:MAG: ABC transporter substrate-binding protein [Desulfobacterales bacterium]|nr:ABC transporter substrate-binding protein [Desulfobacterales bacterium]
MKYFEEHKFHTDYDRYKDPWLPIISEHNPYLPETLLDRRTFLGLVSALGSAAFMCIWAPGCKPSEQDTVSRNKRAGSNHLIMGTAVHMYTIDPAVGFDMAIGSCLKSLYDSLFRHEGNPPRAIPWMVSNYNVSKDNMEWVFELHQNAIFHDGSPVTAEAVRYSFERLMRIGEVPASLFSGIMDGNGVTVIDEHTVKFRLLQPYRWLPHILTWLFIVNPKLVEKNNAGDDGRAWMSEHEVGSGPFKILRWIPGECYTFEAVSDYWRGWPSEKHIDGYERIIIKDTNTRMRAIELGEVDIVDWAPPDVQLRLKKKGFYIVETPSVEIYEIKLNNAEGPTANIYVRKAISYAFDYDALKEIWGDRCVVTQGPLSPSMKYYSRDIRGYRMNLDKAREELSKSPWPNGGFSMDFVYVTGLSEERKTGEIMRDQLAALDIRVNIIPMVWADAVETFKDSRSSPAMFPLYSLSHPDMGSTLWGAYHSSRAGDFTNPGHYRSSVVDDLLERIRASVNMDDIENLHFLLQHQIVDDAANIFCVSPLDHHIYSPRVTNIKYCPVTGSMVDFFNIHLTPLE